MSYNEWRKKPFGEIDSKRLKLLESFLKQTIPVEFIDWLQIVNGGHPDKTICHVPAWGDARLHHVYGLNSGADYLQIDHMAKVLSRNLTEGLLAFADDEGGNQFVVSLGRKDRSEIGFWDHETCNFYYLARSMEEFGAHLSEERLNKTSLDEILKADDAAALDAWLYGKDIDGKNEHGRSAIEEAAIFGSISCIRVLHARGARPFNALKFANNNLEFFPDHKETVDLLRTLYP